MADPLCQLVDPTTLQPRHLLFATVEDLYLQLLSWCENVVGLHEEDNAVSVEWGETRFNSNNETCLEEVALRHPFALAWAAQKVQDLCEICSAPNSSHLQGGEAGNFASPPANHVMSVGSLNRVPEDRESSKESDNFTLSRLHFTGATTHGATDIFCRARICERTRR